MATCPPQRPGPGPRVVLDGVISTAACLELVAAARALAVVGYRHCVCSATIFDVAAAAPELLPPLVRSLFQFTSGGISVKRPVRGTDGGRGRLQAASTCAVRQYMSPSMQSVLKWLARSP